MLKFRSVAALLVCLVVTAILPVGARAAGSTATGQVFLPNPVADLGVQSLTDRKDADYFSADPFLKTAYHRVTLTDLDGSGALTGAYARVKSSTGKAASASSVGFIYTRDRDQFEQVMAYYWVTRAQQYLQSLGFGSGYPAVNRRQLPIRINQFGGDNAFYSDTKQEMTLGKGGVDDGEDADVIVHEYGHAVQDAQVPGFGTSLEAGAIGEGFSDYLAVAVTQWTSPVADPACIGDWDSTSYTLGPVHCLRRIDGPKSYPGDLVGEVHDDGEIWSAALWDIRTRLGAARADTIIVLAQFDFAAATSMRAAAAATIATAQRIYGTGARNSVRAAFAARGLT